MLIIFVASAQPSTNLPDFDWADGLVKKGGHLMGYALLAIAYWRGLGHRRDTWLFAWMLAVLYAVTDEVHQTFVAGRTASVWDVVIFDSFGALSSLILLSLYKRQRSDPEGPIVEQIRGAAG